MVPLIPVVAGVAVRDGRVFLARRPPNTRHAGLWEFPGGKVERGESDAEALVRELREELAVEAKVGAHVVTTQDGAVELRCYAVALLGEPRPLDGQQLGWFSGDELASLPTPPADQPALRMVMDHLRGV